MRPECHPPASPPDCSPECQLRDWPDHRPIVNCLKLHRSKRSLTGFRITQCREIHDQQARAEETSLIDPLGVTFLIESTERWRDTILKGTVNYFLGYAHLPEMPPGRLLVAVVDHTFDPDATDL